MILKIYDFFLHKSFLSKKVFLILIFIAINFILYIFFKNIIFSLFLGFCIYITFSEIFSAVNDKRKEILHRQLIEFVINMIIMVKAGKSVRNIIIESVQWIKMPLKYYVKSLSNELNLNFIFDEALDNFAARCSSREAVLISTALKLSNKTGGDLVFVLNNIIETLQDSLKTKSRVGTITLQSRYSGNIIALLPVFILVFLFFFMNSSIQEFFSNRIGNIFLIAGGILEIAGITVIRKILSVSN
ncbi:MAG: hypothetical protein FJW69_00715 [Actinobacteria bacterium]|nr:hypothetical protein [Actinomycetota bacterium]MBM3711967.1 hypothetical protein [Actinomycetota bacterium]